jgi:malate permease and related proteins
MSEILLHAYTPLLFWIGLGVVGARFLPLSWPRLLGRGLFWIGLPLEIFALARQTHFSILIWRAPLYTAVALLCGFLLGWLGYRFLQPLLEPPAIELPPTLPLPAINDPRTEQGSFILSTMLGNTGFVGIAIASTLISTENLVWAIVYTVSQNLLGSWGMGVIISNHFGRPAQPWWQQLPALLKVPSLWAFALGWCSQDLPLPGIVETALEQSIWIVIPAAFVLTGLRLSQLSGWQSLKLGGLSALLKVLLLPLIMGTVTTLTGITGEPRFALVLMTAMPTAFAALILAEEYNLDPHLPTSAIAVGTFGLLLLLPLWVAIFG